MEQTRLADSPIGQLLDAIETARKVCPDRVAIYQRQLDRLITEKQNAAQTNQQV